MTIKNRIKKIESRINAGKSEDCQCPGTLKFDTVIHENGKPRTAEPVEKLPEHCRNCLKPINKSIIIVDIIDSPREVRNEH